MKKISIATQILKNMLKNVKNAASKAENRPVFKGILLEVEEKELTMVTCDGYKLFTSNCKLIEGDNLSTIIPVFTIPAWADKVTRIEIDDNFITFDFGNVKYSYKLIKGEFIDWKNIIRRESDFSIRFNAEYLKQAFSNTSGTIELYFKSDRDAMIIEELENRKNKKYILPISKSAR